MQPGLMEHYLTEFFDTWLKNLALKFPMSPLNAILTNYLYFSEDGTENSRLSKAARDFYILFKTLEEIPDEQVVEQVDGTSGNNEQTQAEPGTGSSGGTGDT